MKRTGNRNWVLAALAAASLISVPAFGQTRANQDGHAADASNQVGSGGYNLSNGRGGGITSNQIIYGNVTGGFGFTGPHERDPSAFTGPIPSLSSNFIRGSSGAPQAYSAPNVTQGPQPFYGENRGVAPPIGTERLGISSGQNYVGTQFLPDNPYSLRSDVAGNLSVYSQRLGESSVIGARTTLLNTDLGEQMLTGPLEAQNQANIYTGSPLYGVRDISGLTGVPGEDQGIPTFAPPSLAAGGTDRFRFQPSEIQKMRQELNSQTVDPGQLQNGVQQNGNQNSNQQSSSLNAGQNLSNPSDAPGNPALNQQNNQGSNLNRPTLNSTTVTQQNMQSRMTLVPARQQSTTVRELQDRFRQYENPQLQQIRANAQMTNQMAAAAKARTAKTGGAAGPTSRPASDGFRSGFNLPSGNNLPNNTPNEGISTANMPKNLPPVNLAPVQVKSLAEGVPAKGLHDLLASAEDLMRQDKFQSAIEKYDTAEKVAPNNALIPLGRANAELGAGYYKLASTDLHQVFEAEPALLMGQYDLKGWMSADRLSHMKKELADLALSDPSQETPVFLLAYLSYNTGEESQAADYLKEAKKRSGGKDPLVDELESRWRLSAGIEKPAAPEQENKTPDLNR